MSIIKLGAILGAVLGVKIVGTALMGCIVPPLGF